MTEFGYWTEPRGLQGHGEHDPYGIGEKQGESDQHFDGDGGESEVRRCLTEGKGDAQVLPGRTPRHTGGDTSACVKSSGG